MFLKYSIFLPLIYGCYTRIHVFSYTWQAIRSVLINVAGRRWIIVYFGHENQSQQHTVMFVPELNQNSCTLLYFIYPHLSNSSTCSFIKMDFSFTMFTYLPTCSISNLEFFPPCSFIRQFSVIFLVFYKVKNGNLNNFYEFLPTCSFITQVFACSFILFHQNTSMFYYQIGFLMCYYQIGEST